MAIKKYFGLLHNKETKKLIIYTNPNLSLTNNEITSEVKYHNYCYFYSSNRNAIKSKAEELKRIWIEEAEINLERMKNIEIKSKYNRRK